MTRPFDPNFNPYDPNTEQQPIRNNNETPTHTKFSNRLGRLRYTGGILGASVLSAIASSLVCLAIYTAEETLGKIFFFYTFFCFPVAFIVPYTILTVRRLNDIGVSGYWAVLPLPLLLVFLFVFDIFHDLAFVVLATFIINNLFTLFLCIKKGDVDSDNAYGPPPPPNDVGGFIQTTLFGFFGVFGTLFVLGAVIFWLIGSLPVFWGLPSSTH
jgi:uncharacterized membrane protein YhaH (DUF805 family)